MPAVAVGEVGSYGKQNFDIHIDEDMAQPMT